MIRLFHPHEDALVLRSADGHDHFELCDNYGSEDMQGRELYLSVQINVNAAGTHAEKDECVSLDRKSAESVRDWLNAWLVRTEP